jgi:uncharacterized protein (UPF0305 family)
MKHADSFNEKYTSPKIKSFLEELIQEITELKRQNYHASLDIEKRNDQIKENEFALKELGIEITEPMINKFDNKRGDWV